jgi:hypothetical protein
MNRLFGGLSVDDVEVALVEAFPFSLGGPLTVKTGTFKVYTEGDYVVETIRASVGGGAPAGSAVIVDVNKNGTTIYTNQANRPQIAAGATTGTGNSPAITAFTAGDYITVDVDAVGSTTPGTDLTVVVRLRKI